MVSRVASVHSHRTGKKRYSDISLVQVVGQRPFSGPQAMQYLVFIGEADQRTIRTENVDMRTATQGTGRKRRRIRHGIERLRKTGPICFDDHSTSAGRPVRPVGHGVFRPVNENDAIALRVGRDDSARGIRPCSIEYLDLSGWDVHPFYCRGRELIIPRPRVVDNPRTVGRPHVRVGEEVALWLESQLTLGGGHGERRQDSQCRGKPEPGSSLNSECVRERASRTP